MTGHTAIPRSPERRAWTWWQRPPVPDARWFRGGPALHAAALLATIATTAYVGGWHYADFLTGPAATVPEVGSVGFWLGGLWFSASVLAILGTHEWGHYAACRHYAVPASLPFFLPAPLPLSGTLGAFIRIRGVIPHKRALFDIGASGPLAGFVVAAFLLAVGLWLSRLVPVPPEAEAYMIELGEPLLYRGLEYLLIGQVPEGQMVQLHPVARAAWFGLLATALNLFPLSQLDGGHIAYAVFGHRAKWLSLATAVAALGLTFVSMSWVAWSVGLIAVLAFTGLQHPPTGDDGPPLDRRRLILAAAAAVVFFVCFTPAPVELVDSPDGSPADAPSSR